MQNLSKSLDYWIQKLQLLPHPEGGYFKETYRAEEMIQFGGFDSARNISTSIYYALTESGFSSFHRIKSDEIWHFHYGCPAIVHLINSKGNHETKIVGVNDQFCGDFQVIIPKNTWFAAETLGNYTLVGCTVAPGFNFLDFEMGEMENLIRLYPQHDELIRKFCR